MQIKSPQPATAISALPQELPVDRPYSRASKERCIPTPPSGNDHVHQRPLPASQSPQLMNGNRYPPLDTSPPDLRPSVDSVDSIAQTTPPAVEAEKEIIIALIGVTGAGKSYFIKQISGLAGVEVGDGLESCTATVQPYTFTYEGRKITLVDTPGFNDTDRSATQVLKDIFYIFNIVAWTAASYRVGQLLSGIIYLHRITDIRMDGSALKYLWLFRSLCGESALRNVLLTTTQWSNVDPIKGEERERELKTKGKFWKPPLDRGATLSRFYGDQQSGLELIHKLMGREPKALDIQEQIVDQNMPLIGTSAGQALHQSLLKSLNSCAEDLESTKEALQEAQKSNDTELVGLLTNDMRKAKGGLNIIQAELRLLLMGLAVGAAAGVVTAVTAGATESLLSRQELEKLSPTDLVNHAVDMQDRWKKAALEAYRLNLALATCAILELFVKKAKVNMADYRKRDMTAMDKVKLAMGASISDSFKTFITQPDNVENRNKIAHPKDKDTLLALAQGLDSIEATFLKGEPGNGQWRQLVKTLYPD
ncbi:P-loop containing nucleoside triphosphate hydrolase protein [Sphaerosporella brunnea]|uniref:P-loop containing nucleoside triphosphate hydrolase protein n=1 Tax=Sphaerosporella brunnea TaxID=1250544 RepID=A0A5J5F9P7_9PEZI|nr:P-loop containing nucleoside triphosphate hydrolase protein [Sphaerosporella brunnea]